MSSYNDRNYEDDQPFDEDRYREKTSSRLDQISAELESIRREEAKIWREKKQKALELKKKKEELNRTYLEGEQAFRDAERSAENAKRGLLSDREEIYRLKSEIHDLEAKMVENDKKYKEQFDALVGEIKRARSERSSELKNSFVADENKPAFPADDLVFKDAEEFSGKLDEFIRTAEKREKEAKQAAERERQRIQALKEQKSKKQMVNAASKRAEPQKVAEKQQNRKVKNVRKQNSGDDILSMFGEEDEKPIPIRQTKKKANPPRKRQPARQGTRKTEKAKTSENKEAPKPKNSDDDDILSMFM